MKNLGLAVKSLTIQGIISMFNSTTKMLRIYHSCLPNAKKIPSIHIPGWSCCLTAAFRYCWVRLEMDTEDPSLHASRPLYFKLRPYGHQSLVQWTIKICLIMHMVHRYQQKCCSIKEHRNYHEKKMHCKIKPAVLMQSEVYQSRDPQPNAAQFKENKALQKHQKSSLQF